MKDVRSATEVDRIRPEIELEKQLVDNVDKNKCSSANNIIWIVSVIPRSDCDTNTSCETSIEIYLVKVV